MTHDNKPDEAMTNDRLDELSSLSLHVEAFGGQSVEACVRDIAKLSARLGIWVTADINGVHVLSAPNGGDDVLWANYQKATARRATFVSHNVIPRGRALTTEDNQNG